MASKTTSTINWILILQTIAQIVLSLIIATHPIGPISNFFFPAPEKEENFSSVPIEGESEFRDVSLRAQSSVSDDGQLNGAKKQVSHGDLQRSTSL